MFPRYTSLVLPSLARRQANAVEFATKVWFSLFGGSEVIPRLTLGTMGKLCSDSETCDLHSVQIYICRQKLRLIANIVAVHYDSYQRANKHLYKVVDQPFDMFDLHTFFF